MITAERPTYTPETGFDVHERTYNDVTTWLAETVDGPMRTEFSYTYRDGELFADDGAPLTPIFENALADAERLAREQPELAFEVRRRRYERHELDLMKAMAEGQAPNTLVVTSDFPPELMATSKDVGGYNVRRKQTMQRVITLGTDGRISMVTQSLDGSDRRALKAVYTHLGLEPTSDELLGQPIELSLSLERQQTLSAELTGVYDRSLIAQKGGEWYAGCSQRQYQNSYDFVCAQQDLIKPFVELYIANPLHAETLRYGLAARIAERYNQAAAGQAIQDVGFAGAPLWQFVEELQDAGNRARQAGKTFSGCGLSERAALEQTEDSGYGNQADKAEKDSISGKVRCINASCRKYVPKRLVVKERSWRCPECKFEIDICKPGGKVINPGNQSDEVQPQAYNKKHENQADKAPDRDLSGDVRPDSQRPIELRTTGDQGSQVGRGDLPTRTEAAFQAGRGALRPSGSDVESSHPTASEVISRRIGRPAVHGATQLAAA